MKSPGYNGRSLNHCTSLLFVVGVVLAVSLVQSASGQENPRFHSPDSARAPEHLYNLSMSPGLIFALPALSGGQLSLTDQFMIDPDTRFHTYGESWKRTFLLGASANQTSLLQMPTYRPGKPTFFQNVQVVLGVAELAGAAYLGYKAIKKEPVTKKGVR